jgi:carboxynorspermidine decarboxylase
MLSDFSRLDLARLPSPCFVVDETVIERNLDILHTVGDRAGVHVLAALKAFSLWGLAPLYAGRVWGTCASGLHEALLAAEFYPGERHVFSAGYSAADLEQILPIADHVVFNSMPQWLRFRDRCLDARRERPGLSFGLRINPEHSEGTVPIYDPCAPGSRLGIPRDQLDEAALDGISGLHFHTLCEQMLDPLARTVAAFEEKFGSLIPQMEWINFGGGHHITAPGYDVEGLIRLLQDFRQRWDCELYLEPGEAIAIGSGVLVSEVLDVTTTDTPQVILDTSATCHMPDTLEMPYRADILGAGAPGEHPHTYRLGGLTCLAGDVMGDYSFPAPLKVGQRLVFEDMSHYTMVKTTTFNGTRLPSIAIWNSRTDALRVVREFGYEDFRDRLSRPAWPYPDRDQDRRVQCAQRRLLQARLHP